MLESLLGKRRQVNGSRLAHLNWTCKTIEKMNRVEALNDCFHIWHSCSCATINGFRLGRVAAGQVPGGLDNELDFVMQVSWHEINAALGEIVLLLQSINFANTSIGLTPRGNYSKISKGIGQILFLGLRVAYADGDPQIQYHLYTDDSFSLLPKRNFNLAMLSLVRYTQELGLSIHRTDPALQFPYKIQDHTINSTVVLYASNDAMWTRAMKFLLTDLKWVIAWVVKYGVQHTGTPRTTSWAHPT
jgi:beclin 1